MNKLLLMTALGLTALGLNSNPAKSTTIMIDDFNNGFTNKTMTGPAPQEFSTFVSASGIIGGSRNIEFQLTEAPNPSRTANLFINAGNGTLSLSNTVEANSFVRIGYGPGLNALFPSNGRFVFPVVNTDGVTSQLAFSVNGETRAVSITGAGNVYIPGNSFSGLADIDSLELLITGEPGYDIELQEITYEYPEYFVNEPSFSILGAIASVSALMLLKTTYLKTRARD
jgi:hypothetical protein